MSQIVSRQDMTAEYLTKDQQATWLLNLKRIEKKTDIACCLQARDSQGFGSGFQMQNGVIECQKL